MADEKISALNALTVPDNLDVLPIVDVSAVETKKITYADLVAGITGMTNPMTTLGDIIYGAAAGAPTRLAGNITATRKFLRQTGTGAVSAAPVWDTLVAGDIPSLAGTYGDIYKDGSVAFTGQETFGAGLKTDTITEATPGNGILITSSSGKITIDSAGGDQLLVKNAADEYLRVASGDVYMGAINTASYLHVNENIVEFTDQATNIFFKYDVPINEFYVKIARGASYGKAFSLEDRLIRIGDINVLDSGLLVTMDYTTGSFALTNTILDSKLGINTASPTEALEVVGNAIISGKLTVGGAIDPTHLYLDEQAGNPANVANKGILYTKDVGGLTQLFYIDSAGTVKNLSVTGTGDALTSNPLSQFAATTSLQLLGVISDETGTGSLVFATSPTLVTPILGTPTSGNLANCTFPTLNQNTTGSAATLTTPRTINGVAFDGSANITVTADASTLTGTTLNATVVTSSLTTVGTIATGVWNGTIVSPTYGGTGVNNVNRQLTLSTNSAILNFTLTGLTLTVNGSTVLTGGSHSGTNSGDQTSIVGITGTKAQFSTAVTDGDILYVGDVTQYTDEMAQDAIGAMISTAFTYTDVTPLLALTARTIGGVSFDGTANITVATATGGFTVSGGNLALGTNSITMSGSIGVTGTRVTKGWFTDLEVTNAIVGSITGSAPTLTTSRNINGVAFNGSADITVTAAAGTLTGATLAAGVTASSLTSVGTLTGLTMGGALTLVAGTTTVSSINFPTAAALRTTPAAGDMEYDGKVFYNDFAASQRGVNVTVQFASNQAGDLTLNSDANTQPYLNTGNDVLTVLGSTTYFFETDIFLTTGTTSHTIAFDFGGTATFTAVNYQAISSGGVANTTITSQGNTWVTQETTTVVTVALTTAAAQICIRGFIRINGAGTIIPRIKFSANPTGTNLAKSGCWFRLSPYGTNTVASVGAWA